MLKVFNKITAVKSFWGVKSNKFLHLDFLHIYYNSHKQIKHMFVIGEGIRMYAHIFKLTFTKTKNYLENSSLANILLGLIKFDVLYLTNSFITNVPSFVAERTIVLKELLYSIKDNYSLIVVPDFLFEDMIVEDNDFTKIEVEEEMILPIKKEWIDINHYVLDLKKKYRNKIKSILNKTSNVDVRNLSAVSLEGLAPEISNLFDQVVESSEFQGPRFNTESFASFVKKDFMKVDGYFIDNKLVGFSSEIQQGKRLYSYFVGFDKQLNKKTPIYGRILLQNISSAIRHKKSSLVLGRTANEYKSNFGAYPIKSFIYIKIKNRFLRFFFRPIYANISVKKWKLRRPFKI